MKKLLSAALAALCVMLPFSPALAQVPTAYQAQVGNKTINVPDTTANPHPVTCISGCGAPAAYTVTGNAALSVTSASARVALPSADTTVVLSNTGAAEADCAFGNGSVTATTVNSAVLPGIARTFSSNGQLDLACITPSGSTTVKIETGTGSPVFGLSTDFSQPSSVKLLDSAGVNGATVKAASTAPTTTDPAFVVTLSPTPSPVCTSSVAINQATSTDVLTTVAKANICSIILVSSTAQSVSIVEGTGSVCATGIAALVGATSADSTHGMPLTANGGLSAVADRTWLKSKTTADHICILQSSTGVVSGIITYSDAA